MARTKAQWCAVVDGSGPRDLLERAAWAVTPSRSRTRFVGRHAIRTDPPIFTQPIHELSDEQLSTYVRSRCQLHPPKGRWSNSVPLGRGRRS